jgi:hypothetical protein
MPPQFINLLQTEILILLAEFSIHENFWFNYSQMDNYVDLLRNSSIPMRSVNHISFKLYKCAIKERMGVDSITWRRGLISLRI